MILEKKRLAIALQKVHKLNRQTLYDLVILRGGYQGSAGQENFKPEVWLSQKGQEFPWVKTRMGLTHIVCEKEHQTWSSTSQAQLLFQPLVSFEPGWETKNETFMSFNLLHYIIMVLPFQGCYEKYTNIPTCLPSEAMDLNTWYGHHRKTQAGWKTGICGLRSLARADGAGMASRPCSNQEPRKERKNGTVTPSPTAEVLLCLPSHRADFSQQEVGSQHPANNLLGVGVARGTSFSSGPWLRPSLSYSI